MEKWHADDGNAEIVIACDSGKEAAQEYVDTGDWGPIEATTWISVRVWREALDDAGEPIKIDEDWHKISLDPAVPSCSHDAHDWHEVGVWGHGAGVRMADCCRHCGCGRHIDTWAQDPEDGEQGLNSIRYQPADVVAHSD